MFNNKTLPNLKVLVAEDNEVNKLLAKSMLQHWGLQSKTATTGNEAVSMLINEDFDLILMDIQMPDKNGIEAAMEIRSLPNTKKRNTPIIALTANAIKGEEKKYFAVGMNDFLTKPFKELDLLDVIKRVINNGDFITKNYTTDYNLTQHVPMNEHYTPNNKLYNLALVKEATQGNEDFIKNLVVIFLETIPQTSKEMIVACANNDWIATGKLAHKLKSTIDTMLITSLKEDIRAIESNGKNQTNTHLLTQLVLKVDSTIEKVALQLRQEFNL